MLRRYRTSIGSFLFPGMGQPVSQSMTWQTPFLIFKRDGDAGGQAGRIALVEFWSWRARLV